MLEYYCSLFRKLPGLCFHAYRMWTALAGLGSLALLINRPVLRRLQSDMGGLSEWWSLAPIGALSLYGLMRANYDEITTLRGQVSDPKRIALKSAIGELMREGKGLSPTRDALRAWERKTYSLLERALGVGEAERFLTEDHTLNIMGGDKTYFDRMQRISRLADLVARSDAINIAPDYQPKSNESVA